MAERSLTFLEIHFDEASVQIGSKTFGTTDDEGGEDGETTTSGSDDVGSGRGLGRLIGGAVLVGLVLIAVAALAWKLLGTSDLDSVTDLDELADNNENRIAND